MHLKKHLKFKSLIEVAKDRLAKVKDTRSPNSSNSISDVMGSSPVIVVVESRVYKSYNDHSF